MSLMGRLLRLAGKKDFQLDKKIGMGYILGLCWRFGWMLVRGKCTCSLSGLGRGMKIGDRSTFGNDCFFGQPEG